MADDAGLRRSARICALVAFGTTSLLALAGADWPPPPGFLILEALLGVLSVIVYIRVRSRLAARRCGRRVPVAALEGVLAGFAFGLSFVATRAGDPDINLNIGDHVVWLSVLAVVGGCSAQALWALAVRIDRTGTAPPLEDSH